MKSRYGPGHMANYIPRMTAAPPLNNRLWHPSRGISFSPAGLTCLASASPARPARPAAEVSLAVGQYRHVVTSQSIGTQTESWPKTSFQQTTSGLPRGPLPLSSLDLQQPAENMGESVSEQVEEEMEEEMVPESQLALEWDVTLRRVTDEPPPQVLEYKMADDVFYAAKEAMPGSPESFWSYAQYMCRAEDGSLRKPTVHYCRSTNTMERVCQHFIGEKVLGFDLEWVVEPSKRVRNGVSLIQLASPSRIALFHVALFPKKTDMVGPSFKRLMEDPEVTKVGVAIKGDATRLRNALGVDSRGLIELSNLYRLVTYSRTRQYSLINRKLVPLATQVQEYLHLPLFKGSDVRSSDWSNTLNMDQVKYSASDAYAGVQLYATLEHHRKQLDPCPPHPHFAELNLAIQLADGVNVEEVDQETVDIESDETTTSVTVVKKRKTRVSKAAEGSRDSRVEIAEDKAASYRNAHPLARATLAQLRAYFLWHSYDLTPFAIAGLLRDPPLKTATVLGYILTSVQLEKLPTHQDRLRELTQGIPARTLWSRFPAIATALDLVHA